MMRIVLFTAACLMFMACLFNAAELSMEMVWFRMTFRDWVRRFTTGSLRLFGYLVLTAVIVYGLWRLGVWAFSGVTQ